MRLGTLSDMERIGDLCEQYNAIYHADTVQTMGHYQHDLSKLKVHFMVCAAHKLHGPKGIGFLHVNHRDQNKAIYLWRCAGTQYARRNGKYLWHCRSGESA